MILARLAALLPAILLGLAFWPLSPLAAQTGAGATGYGIAGLALLRFILGAVLTVITWVITRRPWDALVACGVLLAFDALLALQAYGAGTGGALMPADMLRYLVIRGLALNAIPLLSGAVLTAWRITSWGALMDSEPERWG